MKRIITSLLFTFIILPHLISQSASIESIKAYPIKDYQSPDIKLRQLMLGSTFASDGSYEKENSERDFNFRLNGNLNYYQYTFNEKYQGISTSYFNLDLESRPHKKDDIKSTYNNISSYLDYFNQSRIYYPNNVFWGIHSGSIYKFGRSSQKLNNENNIYINNDLSITPYFSIGKGRVQPVRSARTAMDILISLEKYDRLKRQPSHEEIDALAKVANEIVYKRFYDDRFKYIYQLEELDKSLQSMDLVDTADIVYFANLNDIWAYGNWQRRGSGGRFEGGLIPTFNGRYQNADESLDNMVDKDQILDYAMYGFLSLNYFLPRSYAWQSDIFIDLTFGSAWNENAKQYSDDFTSYDYYSTSQTLNGMLNINWEFSYFPNTRTQLSITPFVSLSYQKMEESDAEYGIRTGLYFSTYYYLSPRFRISAGASVNYYDNFLLDSPAPFWNTFLYRDQNKYRELNDVVTRQYDRYPTQDAFLGYSLNFSISYAIF